jgi:hypothetical protein
MTRRTDIDERELRDPALAALLQETFRDDPALAPAPGRTERIMRAVLAPGKRRQAHPFWASLAWGFGATATAALLLALIIGLGKPGEQMVEQRPIQSNRPQEQAPIFTVPSTDDIAIVPDSTLLPPKQEAIPAPVPKPEEKTPAPWTPPPGEQHEAPAMVPPAPDQQEVIVASALYEAGATAYSTGDYETAYLAFQDSYDTVPTPEAALSTGNVLIRMAREELASANSDI